MGVRDGASVVLPTEERIVSVAVDGERRSAWIASEEQLGERIVRCGACSGAREEPDGRLWCGLHALHVREDDFCSMGTDEGAGTCATCEHYRAYLNAGPDEPEGMCREYRAEIEDERRPCPYVRRR